MRHAFLDLLRCPVTHEPLTLIAAQEREAPIARYYAPAATAVAPPAAAVGLVAPGAASDVHAILQAHRASPGDPDRQWAAEIESGVLVSASSGRWYPVIDGVPELLPDSLRDWARDVAFLRAQDGRYPDALRPHLIAAAERADGTAKSGDTYKRAERAILEKVDDPSSFLGPGLYSPFCPGIHKRAADLIRGFACWLPFARLDLGSVVLDSGCGYAWTTEWMLKLGLRAVGVELNRVYVDTGRTRMGPVQPEFVIADAENLPFAPGIFDVVLGFDAFHHIPSRPRAMAEFARALKSAGRVVLVEPGEAHQLQEDSIKVMERYGILELGMTLEDVRTYVRDLPYADPNEVFLVPLWQSDQRTMHTADLQNRDFIGWSMFVIERL